MDIRIIVTIADSHIGIIAEVAAQLRAAGMTVEQVLETVGVVTGVVSQGNLPRLSAVPGVVSVEEETTFQAL